MKKRKKENFNLILAFDKSIFNLHSTKYLSKSIKISINNELKIKYRV